MFAYILKTIFLECTKKIALILCVLKIQFDNSILKYHSILHDNNAFCNNRRDILFHSSWMAIQSLQSIIGWCLDNAKFKSPKGQKCISDTSYLIGMSVK